MTLFRRLMALAVAACALPLVSMLTAAGIANLFKCRLHEGNVNPCVVGGVDIGAALYGMAVGAWLMLFTLPLAVMLVALWAVVEVVHRVRRTPGNAA